MKLQSFTNLSSVQLRRAAVIQDKIEALTADLAKIIGRPSPSSKPKKRRKMSRAARAKIAAGAKARWAKVRAAKKS